MRNKERQAMKFYYALMIILQLLAASLRGEKDRMAYLWYLLSNLF